MGNWQHILFERRLLKWSCILSLVGMAMWIVSLGSQHWLVQVPKPLVHNTTFTIPSTLLSSPSNNTLDRGLIWSHSGLYSLSSLVETENSLYWKYQPWILTSIPVLRSELIMAGFSLLLAIAAILFSVYSVKRPYLILRRLAAILYILVAGCIMTVIQLVDTGGHSGKLHPPSPHHNLHYGYSFLLAWVSALLFVFISISFFCASRKRKLLRNDNVTFQNQRLIIERLEDEKS